MAIKSKKTKTNARTRSKFRIRKRILASSDHPRVSVFRSSKFIYAQVVSDATGQTLASASSIEKEVQAEVDSVLKEFEKVHGKSGEKGDDKHVLNINSARSAKSVAAALAVGSVLAKRAIANSVSDVVFDRSGYLYHGRVQAVAEGARLRGLKF